MILIATAGKVGTEAARLLAKPGCRSPSDNARAVTLMADGDCDYRPKRFAVDHSIT